MQLLFQFYDAIIRLRVLAAVNTSASKEGILSFTHLTHPNLALAVACLQITDDVVHLEGMGGVLPGGWVPRLEPNVDRACSFDRMRAASQSRENDMQDHGPSNMSDHLSPRGWDDALAAAGPAMLLLVVEQRMGEALLRQTSPEDILQVALLHAWRDRASHRWQSPRTFRNWVLSIIDHRIQDARDYHSAVKRGGGVRPQSLSPATPSDSTGGGGDIPVSTTPSRIASYRDQASAVRTAIESLPDDVRDIVRLRLVEQLQVHEIAAYTGLGESAVRHRFRRGAEMFRYRLTSLLGTKMEGGIRPQFRTVDGQTSSP